MKSLLLLIVISFAAITADAGDIMWMNRGQTGFGGASCISGNGRYLVASYELIDSLFIWDLYQKKIVKGLKRERMNALTISYDGSKIAYSSDRNKGKLKVYDWQKDSVLTVIDSVNTLLIKFSPDGNYIAFNNDNYGPKPWGILYFRISDGKMIRKFNLFDFNSFEFSPDGSILASYENVSSNNSSIPDSNFVDFSNVNTGEVLRKVSLGNFYDNSSVLMGFKKTGTEFVILCETSIYFDLTYFRIDVNSGIITETVDWYGYGIKSNRFLFNPDVYVIATFDGKIKYFNNKSRQAIDSFDVDVNIFPVGSDPDGRTVIMNAYDRIYLWDVEKHKITDTLIKKNNENHFIEATDIDISPDGKYAVSASFDYTIKLWDTETGAIIKTFFGHKSGVLSAKFSPDGKKILSHSGNYENAIKIWDVAGGTCLNTFKHEYSDYFSTGWIDNTRIISCGINLNTYIINSVAGQITDTVKFNGHNIQAGIFAKSRDNEYLALCSDSTFIFKKDKGNYIEYSLIPNYQGIAAFSSDNLHLAYENSLGDTLHFFDLENKTKLPDFLKILYHDTSGTLYGGMVYRLKYFNNSNLILCNINDEIIISSTETFKIMKIFKGVYYFPYYRHNYAALSNDDRILISAMTDGSIVRWNLNGGMNVGNPDDIKDIKIFPNPVSEKLHIRSNRELSNDIQIFDILGQRLWVNIERLSENEYISDCSGLMRGLYFLRINSGNKTEIIKFIKE